MDDGADSGGGADRGFAGSSSSASASSSSSTSTLPLDFLCGADPVGAPCYVRAGRELWATSEGTLATTQRVADMAPGTASANPGPFAPIAVDTGLTGFGVSGQTPVLLFPATVFPFGAELWASDQTGASYLVQDIRPGPFGSDPEYLVPVPGRANKTSPLPIFPSPHAQLVLFAADDGIHGRELWRSAGARAEVTSSPGASTRMVLDLSPGPGGSSPMHLYAPPVDSPLSGLVFFSAEALPTVGREVYVSDGTPWGTMLVLDVCHGRGSSDPAWFTEYKGRVFFAADDCIRGRELWVTTGPESMGGTTLLVADIARGAASSSPAMLAPFLPAGASEPLLHFVAATPSPFGGVVAGGGRTGTGFQLWRTEGNANTTLSVLDGSVTASHFDLPAASLSTAAWAHPFARLVDFRGSLFFTARRGREWARDMPAQTTPGEDVQGIVRPVSFVLSDPDCNGDGLCGGRQYRVRLESAEGKGRVLVDPEPADLAALAAAGETLPALREFSTLDGGRADPNAVSFVATLPLANLLLRRVVYRGLPRANGLDRIVITVEDADGNALDGDAASAHKALVSTSHVDIELLAVNEPPTLSASLLASEKGLPVRGLGGIGDDPVTFPPFPAGPVYVRLRLDDPDAVEASTTGPNGEIYQARMRLLVSSTGGLTFGLQSVSGLTFEKGKGYDDTELVALGSLPSLAYALDSVEISCSASRGCSRPGSGSLTVRVSDQGHTGTGGPKEAAVEVEVRMTAE